MNERQVLLAQYFADTALLDCCLVSEKPSRVAACCVYASLKICKGTSKPLWNKILAKNTSYKEAQVSGMAENLLDFVCKVEKSSYQNMKKKYSSSRYGEVAKIMKAYALE
jgi:hypothetical protein